MKYIGGNIFINFLAATISECAGNFGAGFLQKFFGTKKAFIICYLTALFIFMPLLFSKSTIVVVIVVFICKFFVEGAFLIAYNVNYEVFPSLFVPFSFSVSGFLTYVVTIVSPQIAEIKQRQIPIFIFIIFSGIASTSALFLTHPKKKRYSEENK